MYYKLPFSSEVTVKLTFIVELFLFFLFQLNLLNLKVFNNYKSQTSLTTYFDLTEIGLLIRNKKNLM